LVKKWETYSVLKVPESVLFDRPNQVLYETNIDGTDPWAMDGKGSVGKIGLDGRIIKVDWVNRLNSPKGMGLYKGKLYVADMSGIAVINIKAEKMEKLIPVTGAQGFNDITIDNRGVVYLSNSKTKQVFTVENE
jgi:streptogramin lyase